MRYGALALLACLAGCSLTSGSDPGECVSDSQCGDEVCARGGECLARSSVRSIQVRWTVEGVVADGTSCAAHPELYVQFDGTDTGDTLRFAVACRQGTFVVDNLPKRYQQVELGVEGSTGNVQTIAVGATQARFDLFQ